MPRFAADYEAGDWPLLVGLTDFQRERVLRARDPVWLRERAAECRQVADAGHGRGAPVKLRLAALGDPYLRLRPVAWLRAEADRCEERAAAIDRGERPPDWGVAE